MTPRFFCMRNWIVPFSETGTSEEEQQAAIRRSL